MMYSKFQLSHSILLLFKNFQRRIQSIIPKCVVRSELNNNVKNT